PQAAPGACACTAYSFISRSTAAKPAVMAGGADVGAATPRLAAAARTRAAMKRIMPGSMRYDPGWPNGTGARPPSPKASAGPPHVASRAGGGTFPGEGRGGMESGDG